MINKLDNKIVNNINILVFGDYMLDEYIMGDVNRISPEAPVPVIELKEQQIKLGGAGNVVRNVLSLGPNVRILGCVGNDKNGEQLLNELKKNNADTSYIKRYDEIKTIVKTRIVSKNQQFLRIDEEEKKDIPSDYVNYVKDNIQNILKDIDTLIISDYAKGAVTKDITQILIKAANDNKIPVIVDPKGNDYSKYKNATICTPNVKELETVYNVKIKTEEEILYYGRKLLEEVNLKYLALTRSEKGITLFSKDGEINFPTVAREIIDVTGAGDTVVATIATFICLGIDINDICKLSNIAASIVIAKFGASTAKMYEIINKFSSVSSKLVNYDNVGYLVEDLREKNKKIVFTNGCFDLLHIGHVHSFKQAKKFGDVLLVAVNSDLSVKENKGDKRPIIGEEDRLNMIMELECVDYVILMHEKDPSKLIELIKPDVCVKGKDWEGKQIKEMDIISLYGGQMQFIELAKDKSTTNIIKKVIDVYHE